MASSSDSPIKRLIAEIHRRSLWQVLVGFGAASYAVLEALDLFIERFGLPAWLFNTAALFIFVGLPVVLATAFYQKGSLRREVDSTQTASGPSDPDAEVTVPRLSDRSLGARRVFTWRNAFFGGFGALALWGALAAGWLLLGGASGRDEATSRALSTGVEIERAIARGEWMEAFALARNLPLEVADSARDSIWEAVSVEGTLQSDPPGAEAWWRTFDDPEADWELVGTTPLQWRFPRSLVAVRLEREGYVTRFVGIDGQTIGQPFDDFADATWRLQPLEEAESQGLTVPGGVVSLALRDLNLAHAPPVTISDFVINRYEVTNREFQDFVDAGGYERSELWDQPIERGGEVLRWEEATALFVDRTGRPGPSTWEFGRFPQGSEEYPVTGVSWYEAMAYAKYSGRDLLTLYHWYWAASPNYSAAIVPFSNLQGEAPAPVGSFPGMTLTGASDMAGNAREWVVNAAGELRYTVGGGWDDPLYAFFLSQPQDPLDRSRTNGIRLMTRIGPGDEPSEAANSIDRFTRDFGAEQPVNDDVFAVFRELYDYDDLPLNPRIEAVDTLDFAIRERITVGAAYGSERLVMYLFLPFERVGRLQTVVYFPGSGALQLQDLDAWFETGFDLTVPMLVRSGRAVAFPVYNGTFERQDDYVYRLQDESNSHRDHVIQWRQDLGRSLDYLETRDDVDGESFSYFGFSWGGRMGAIMLAVEPRFQAAVLYVAGLSPLPTQPAVDPFNFAPRVQVPVLMLSGQHDQVYPLDAAARPLYELLGSEEKEHFVAEGGHFVPGEDLVRETTSWFDEHLGSVP